MAKGKVPTRDELLAFIRESATPVGKREIARAYGLKGDQRIELKELLRDLRDAGEITPDRAKTFRDPAALTDITVLEIVRVDNDGHLIAVPRRHDEDKDGPAPHVEIAPSTGSRTGPAPAVGDRVLASLKRRGKNAYEARVIRRLGSTFLRQLGCTVEVLEDGDEIEAALQQPRLVPIDAIVLDIVMRRSDGGEVCRVLREKHDVQLPIIAISSYTSSKALSYFFRDGFDVVIQKPFSREALGHALIEGRARRHALMRTRRLHATPPELKSGAVSNGV